MFYSGIDQHKRDCFITTYDSDGEVVKQQRVPNSAMVIQRYFSQLPGPSCRFLVGSSDNPVDALPVGQQVDANRAGARLSRPRDRREL